MPIRFSCPACHQPLEVDDAWGGESVACPYCKRVITAPQNSTWPAQRVLQASPATAATAQPGEAGPWQQPGFGTQPPPPPMGYAGHVGALPPSPRAVRGLLIALTGLVLVAFAWFGMLGAFASRYMPMMPSSGQPTPEEVQALQTEMMEDMMSGKFKVPPFVQICGVLGALCGLAGAAFGVTAILAGERRRGVAIAACILGVTFCLCPGPLVMTILGPHG